MTSARSRLLGNVIAHIAAHGLGDSSLRDLGGAIGSSHRMLIYHFGSREGLIAAVATTIEEQQRSVLQQLAASSTSPRQTILDQWHVLTQPDVLPLVRVFFEVFAHAVHGHPGTEHFLESLTEPWLGAGHSAASLLGKTVNDHELRLGVAVIRGLLMDVLATGDATAATSALELYVQRWPMGVSTASRPRPADGRSKRRRMDAPPVDGGKL